MLCGKHINSDPPVECIVCMHEEVIRLKHVVAVLKTQIGMAHQSAMHIEEHTRVQDGKLEVWFLGDWVDVEAANAEFPDNEENEVDE